MPYLNNYKENAPSVHKSDDMQLHKMNGKLTMRNDCFLFQSDNVQCTIEQIFNIIYYIMLTYANSIPL